MLKAPSTRKSEVGSERPSERERKKRQETETQNRVVKTIDSKQLSPRPKARLYTQKRGVYSWTYKYIRIDVGVYTGTRATPTASYASWSPLLRWMLIQRINFHPLFCKHAALFSYSTSSPSVSLTPTLITGEFRLRLHLSHEQYSRLVALIRGIYWTRNV